MSYAVGKKALGDCDRCGFTYKLKDLRYEIEDGIRNGLRVCDDCLDIDHPQLKIGEVNTSDNQSLYNPRPDRGEKSSTEYYGFNPVSSTGLVLRTKTGTVKVSTE